MEVRRTTKTVEHVIVEDIEITELVITEDEALAVVRFLGSTSLNDRRKFPHFTEEDGDILDELFTGLSSYFRNDLGLDHLTIYPRE